MRHKAEVASLWIEHMRSRFPRALAGKLIEGIDLVMLDADIAGFTTTYLDCESSSDFHLTYQDWHEREHSRLPVSEFLLKLLDDSDKVSASLEGEFGRYYGLLHTVIEMVCSDVLPVPPSDEPGG